MTTENKMACGVGAFSVLALGFAMAMDHGMPGVDGYVAGLSIGGVWAWTLRGLN